MPDSTRNALPLAVTVSGIGGQGIQLLSKTLALAATKAGRHAMLAADYGGEMRGGPSSTSFVIDSKPVNALPILEETDAIVLSHHKFSERAVERLLPGGVCLVNSSIVDRSVIPAGAQVIEVPAADLAKQLGSPQTSGLILAAAFNALYGLVDHEILVDAMRDLIPPYRQQAIPKNIEAMGVGRDAVAGFDLAGVPA